VFVKRNFVSYKTRFENGGQKMKKRILFVMAILMCLTAGLFAGPGQQGSASGKKRIAVSLPPAENNWQARMLVILNETIKNYPEYDWTVKNAVNSTDQENQLNTFINDKPDLIVILPGDGTLLRATCERIYDAGIKTVIFDRPISPSTKYTACVVGDNYSGGVNAARLFGKRLNGKGDVVVLRSYVGTPIDLDRYNGFKDTIAKEFPNIKILVEGDGEFNRNAGLTAMTNILPGYPKIDAVYTQDDETALGALNAIQNARRTDIKFITGFGGSKEAYAKFQAKDPVYIASMSYLPILGKEAVELAVKVLKGESFEKDKILPSVVVDSSNVTQYLPFSY
jgi:ribose transport system substrate-binding protein